MGPRDKNRGTYFFWADWRGSEVHGLTYAAKGLWIDLLAAMAEKTPQGVITGNLESLAEALGYPGPMARAWVAEYGHLIEELELKSVFSRGAAVDDDLDPDCIVNRRMYRERAKSQDISEARSRAARIRWDAAKSVPEGVVSMAEIRAELASGECKSDAKLCKADAKPMQSKNEESIANKGDSVVLSMQSDAKICYSPTQPTPTQPNPTQPIGVQGCGPMAVGECLSLLQPLTGKSIYERIRQFTKDTGARAKWWNKVVNAFRLAGHLATLDDHLLYVESNGDGIKKPSKYMVSRVLASARELRIEVPNLPEETKQ